MPELSDYYAYREELVRRLRRDLIGPSADDEIIDDPPVTSYVAGVLFPKNARAAAPDQDAESGSADKDFDEAGAPDPPVSMANVKFPSSCGLTFSVDLRVVQEVEVGVECARYEEFEEESELTSDTDRRSRWKRIRIAPPSLRIDLSTPVAGVKESLEGVPNLAVYRRVRPPDAAGIVSVTLALTNEQSAPSTGLRDPFCFFQPALVVRAPGAPRRAFVERQGAVRDGDKDAAAYRLLYKDQKVFAVGHGCAVEWSDEGEPAEFRLCTTFLPEHELLIAQSNPTIPPISMRLLAENDRGKVECALNGLIEGYRRWIGLRESEVADLPGSLQEQASMHLADCRDAADRMKSGLDLLVNDDKVFEAFRLANQAMTIQRSRTQRIREGRPGEDLDQVTCEWRPFQIAFLLLCLPGIAQEDCDSRNLVDLLWFPTGGGKTEAYLGLIAFTVFLRRLRTGDSGITALMRYTLRLLTAQQFERAAALILACESIRSGRQDLGTEQISIGLWVGQGGTPNSLREAKTALANAQRRKVAPDEGNPVQLHRCPWCGRRLDHRNYWVRDKSPRRMMITCNTDGCEFSKGAPVFLVDEDIYNFRPTLLIATVDKFASLAWREDAANVFNLGKEPPPELIVQDELHLVSGPLGTLTGLYETAVDLLCTNARGVGPKIIASTATVRRASEQAQGLFARPLRQFPPPGLSIDDSYFSTTADRDSAGSRLYLGAMAPGVSQTTLMIRAYAALLQAAQSPLVDDELRDAYWTLIGYFNSLRILGGARLQVDDDVRDRIGLLASRLGEDRRKLEQVHELTSRQSSGSIPAMLEQMLAQSPSPDAFDVILATNMISVGVDIDRFGLMVIMGQPQSAAEYIQASSRVGRSYPGLVLTLFNSARSRDRSHYESFANFHGALYRQVEGMSVTPFSPRARDRGLAAVFVALVRMMIPELRARDSASRISEFGAQVRDVAALVTNRAGRVDEAEVPFAAAQLEEIIELWERRAAGNAQLTYYDYRNPERGLLVDAARAEEFDDLIPAPWNLRDVDLESNLYELRWR